MTTPENPQQKQLPFGVSFQLKLLHMLMNDAAMFDRATQYLKPEHFDGKTLQWLYGEMVAYYKKFAQLPTKELLTEFIRVKTPQPDWFHYEGALTQITSISHVAERDWLLGQLKTFIQQHLYVSSFDVASKYYQNQRFDLAFEETRRMIQESEKVDFSPAAGSWFFKELPARMARRFTDMMENDQRFTSGLLQLDDILEGGPARGELCVVVADAKVGKSIFLLGVGASVVLSSMGEAKIAHFNLEGRGGQTEDRYDSRMLMQSYYDVVRNNIPRELENYYKRFSESMYLCNMLDYDVSVAHIEDRMQALKHQGFCPDVVIIDYGDLMVPRHKSHNTYQDQKDVYQDLKVIANKYNCVVWTASQVTRPPQGVNPKEDPDFFYTRYNLADCYAKVRIADLLLTLNMTDEERKAHKLRVYLDAYRDRECGHKLSVHTKYTHMQMDNPTPAELSKSFRNAMTRR